MTTYYLDPAGSDSNAGTARGSGSAWLTLAHAAANVAAGDTVKILGVAGNAASYPTTGLDYNPPSFFTPTAGSATSGWVKWIADETGPMPTIGTTGILFNNVTYQWLEGLYLVSVSDSGFLNFGIVYSDNYAVTLRNCVFNLNSLPSAVAAQVANGQVEDCDFYGGSTSPSFNSGSHLLLLGLYGVHVVGNTFRYSRDHGVKMGGNRDTVIRNRIYGCAGDGIEYPSASDQNNSVISGNTIHGNGGHGVNVSSSAGIAYLPIYNNILTSNGGYGLSVADGSTGTNDLRKKFCDYNWFGSGGLANTSGARANISAGANDLSGDPQYANAGAGDFTPGNAAVEAAFPDGWIGAVQPSGSGSTAAPFWMEA